MTSNNYKNQHATGSTNNTSNIGTQDPNRSLKDKVNDIFNTMSPHRTSECCIYRVPKKLRMINQGAYTPHVISIGPFHHNKDELKFMEKHKVRYLHRYIHTHKVELDDLLNTIKDSEDRVRQCYEESIDLKSDEFVMMVLLDSLFIIEYFRNFVSYRAKLEDKDDNFWYKLEDEDDNFLYRVNSKDEDDNCLYGVKLKDEDDNFLYRAKLTNDILVDLLLLENQLPFFILESLYKILCSHRADPSNDQSTQSFQEISCGVYRNFNKQNITPQREVLHFTDLIRTFHIPMKIFRNRRSYFIDERSQISYYSAKELHETAGVGFTKSLFDIWFEKGVLRIPRFECDNNTESLYRNLIAWEQIQYLDQTYVCDYIVLMDTLINTSRDVELLVKKGIIMNSLGDHEVLATLFNKLCLEVINDRRESYFYKTYQDLFKYYEKSRHKWMTSLKRDYFSSPWKIASVMAATILLVLTLLQTINSY